MSDRNSDEVELERGAVLALLTTGYAGLAIISILLFQFQNGAAGVWLPNVFAVAVLLRNASVRRLPAGLAVFAGCFAANLLIGADPLLSVFYSVANASLVSFEAFLITKGFGKRKPSLDTIGDYGLTLTLGGILAPATVAALFSAFVAVALGWPLLETYVTWVIGEALAFALVLPILMMVSRDAVRALTRGTNLVVVPAAVAASVLFALAAESWSQFPFLLTIVPLMALVAFANPFAIATACAAVGTALVGLVIAGALAGLDSSHNSFTYGFQLSVATVAVLPFAISLVVEQARRDRRQIAESEQRFRRVMEDSTIGVAIVGLDGHIVETNNAFADMLGYSRDEMEKLTFFQITHPEDVAVGADTMRRVRAGESSSYHLEKRYLHKNGSAIWTRLSGSVIRDAATNEPRYLVSQIENIDARRRSEKAIAEAEARWDFALASAGQGVWDVDTRKGRTAYSSTWRHMLGYREDELDHGVTEWLRLIHPDDRERVEAADRAHVAGRTPTYQAEFRMQHKDGRWIWILDRGRVVERDENGGVLRMIGTLTDITQRKESEERLQSYAAMLADEKERLRVTLDSIGDAVICTDAAMQVTYMNPVAEDLTGVARGDAVGEPLARVYAPTDEETGEVIATTAALAGLRQRVEHNSRAMLSKKDGTRCSIREVVSPIVNDKGEFNGSVIVFQDFTDARSLQRRLLHAAAHDSLTALANRASLLAIMAGLVAEPQRSGLGDLFLYVDLDHFKLVNDTSGHAAGDDLLKRVAEVIRSAVRGGDVVARLGGDEFAVILKGCGLKTGKLIAEKLLASISSLDLKVYSVDGNIGASIGLTAIGLTETNVDEIIARADHACYEAKAGGRGRVVVAGSPAQAKQDSAEAAAVKKGLAKAS